MRDTPIVAFMNKYDREAMDPFALLENIEKILNIAESSYICQECGDMEVIILDEDVKIKDYPTHAASLPVAMIPNCAATRHIHFHLDGSGPAILPVPKLEDWPDVAWKPDTEKSQRVNLDTLTPTEVATWKVGQTITDCP